MLWSSVSIAVDRSSNKPIISHSPHAATCSKETGKRNYPNVSSDKNVFHLGNIINLYVYIHHSNQYSILLFQNYYNNEWGKQSSMLTCVYPHSLSVASWTWHSSAAPECFQNELSSSAISGLLWNKYVHRRYECMHEYTCAHTHTLSLRWKNIHNKVIYVYWW